MFLDSELRKTKKDAPIFYILESIAKVNRLFVKLGLATNEAADAAVADSMTVMTDFTALLHVERWQAELARQMGIVQFILRFVTPLVYSMPHGVGAVGGSIVTGLGLAGELASEARQSAANVDGEEPKYGPTNVKKPL